MVGEILKGWRTWHCAYGAAFRHDLAQRLPLVSHGTLVLETAGDPLARYARAAADLLLRGSTAQTTRDRRAAEVEAYLGR